MSPKQKNPVILPKNSHVSRLILRHIHELIGHSGRGYMLAKLRQCYWLLCANSLARNIINWFVFCRGFLENVVEQKMADLWLKRITPNLPPFTHVGLDYLCPIEAKRSFAHVKSYLHLSGDTCCSSWCGKLPWSRFLHKCSKEIPMQEGPSHHNQIWSRHSFYWCTKRTREDWHFGITARFITQWLILESNGSWIPHLWHALGVFGKDV